MSPRQRRNKPLHPARDTENRDHRPRSTKNAFIYKIKHFFIEPELIPDSYPFDRGVIHSKGCMIPYYEFRGDGEPPNDVGIAGDVWFDGTSNVAALYVRSRRTWVAILGVDFFQQQPLYVHPNLPLRVLSCTRKAVVWCDAKTANRHWTATKKECGLQFGEWTLVDVLEDILGCGAEGFITPGTEPELASASAPAGGRGQLANRLTTTTTTEVKEDHVLPVAGPTPDAHVNGLTASPDPLNGGLDDDPLLAWVPDSDGEENRPILTRLSVDNDDRYRFGGEQSAVPFRPALGDDPEMIKNALGWYDDPDRFQSPDEIDSFYLPATSASSDDGRVLKVIDNVTPPVTQPPESMPVTDVSPPKEPGTDTHYFQPPPPTTGFLPPNTTGNRRRNSEAFRSSVTESLRVLTAQAISRRQNDLLFASASSAQVPVRPHTPVSPTAQDGELDTNRAGRDDDVDMADPLDGAGPSTQLSSTASLEQQLLSDNPSSQSGPATGIEFLTEFPSTDGQPQREMEPDGGRRLEGQQAQIEQLLQDVRLLQAEVALLKDANRQLVREKELQNGVGTKMEDTLAWINESKMPAEMHEIAGPVISSIKRAIQLFSAKFEAERAENVKLRKQLGNLNEQPSPETISIDSDDEVVPPAARGVTRTHEEPRHDLIVPELTVTPSRPIRSSNGAAAIPSPSQDIDYASDSTLLSPSPHKGKTRPGAAGYAVGLPRFKAINSEQGSPTRPAKRPRFSHDAPGAGVNLSQFTNSSGVFTNQHLDILYLAWRKRIHCRSCLLRRKKDTGFSPVSFGLEADMGVLSAHCKSEHPNVCERLLHKSDVELAKVWEQVRQTDPQLMDAMIEG